MSAVRSPGHLPHLDGLRALAALTVVSCHSLLPNWHEWPLGVPITSRLRILSLYDNLGHFAVNLFIVLSGFCLMLPVLRNGGVLRGGAAAFLRKRALRILPPYYAAMGISLLLVSTVVGRETGTPWDASLPVSLRDILGNLFLFQNFSAHSGAINHAHWSISLEWWIYFLFPPLLLLWRKAGAISATLAAVMGSGILVAVAFLTCGKGFTLQYVGLFALGMLGARLAEGGPRVRTAVGWGGAVLGVAVLASSRYGVALMGGAVGPVVNDYLVGLASMCLLVHLALSKDGWACRLLSVRPLVFIGTFAYSIYLIHAPLLQVIWQYGIAPLTLPPLEAYVVLKVTGIAMVLVISYGFYLLCERPFVLLNRAHAARTAGTDPSAPLPKAARSVPIGGSA